MSSSKGNIFRVTGPLWCIFYMRLNKRMRKQSRRWWFETPSRSLWRHYNDVITNQLTPSKTYDCIKQWYLLRKRDLFLKKNCLYLFSYCTDLFSIRVCLSTFNNGWDNGVAPCTWHFSIYRVCRLCIRWAMSTIIVRSCVVLASGFDLYIFQQVWNFRRLF